MTSEINPSPKTDQFFIHQGDRLTVVHSDPDAEPEQVPDFEEKKKKREYVEGAPERDSEKRKRLKKEARQEIMKLIDQLKELKSKDDLDAYNKAIENAKFILDVLGSNAALNELFAMDPHGHLKLESTLQRLNGSQVSYSPRDGLFERYQHYATPHAHAKSEGRAVLNPNTLEEAWRKGDMEAFRVLQSSKIDLLNRVARQLR